MENPKYSHEDQQWANDLSHKLALEFPDANIHTDSEHFIYTITSPSGERVEMHTPKWQKIPRKNNDDSVTYTDTEDVIQNNLAK
jgi:hypothetical protein